MPERTNTEEPVESEAPPETKSIDDVPGSIFDPAVVRASGIRRLQEMEDLHNFNRRQGFLLAVSNWERNFLGKRRQGPLPQPVLMLHYTYAEGPDPSNPSATMALAPEITEGPEFVAEPYIPPVKPTLPEGVVAFSFPTEDGTGSYWVGPTNTVQPGTHAVKDGKEYVFIVLGRGTSFKWKLWIPVGS